MVDPNNDSTSTPAVVQPQVGAAMVAGTGAENKEGQVAEATQPQVRTYNEAEWGKRQSSFDKQMSKVSDRVKELEGQQAQAQAKVEEAQYSNWLQAIEDAGGDGDAAGKAIAGIKQAWNEARQVLAQKATLIQQATTLEEAARGKQALDLVKEHSLSPDAVEELLDSKDATEMELKALKLRLEKQATDATAPTKVEKEGGTGKVRDLSTQPTTITLGQLMEESLEK